MFTESPRPVSDGVLPESIQVTLVVVRLLEKIGVRYAIGGSLASAIHGIVRSTMDVDIVAEMKTRHVRPFVEGLGESFYADESRILEAVKRCGSFNVIDQSTVFKIDVFVARDQLFEISQIERRESVPLTDVSDERAFVSSAEDVVLAKLLWYRKGGDVSDRQWNDVLGVVRVQSDNLNREYLTEMAGRLEIEDLLQRAFEEADG